MRTEVLTLIHYAAAPLGSVFSVESQDDRAKPSGLWVSVEGADDWKSWCESEDYHPEGLKYEHEIKVRADANILRLSNARDLDEFSREFSVPGNRWHVRWAAVAARYHGIIITPYIWDRRLNENTEWYYTWDCASGCIWDATAIASVELRASFVVQAVTRASAR
jgi:hypothetical protein